MAVRGCSGAERRDVVRRSLPRDGGRFDGDRGSGEQQSCEEVEVVAEGAETTEIVAALAALGCDTAQGFALTPALPPDELTSWIERYERRAPARVS